MEPMGEDVRSLLKWMAEVAEARLTHAGPRERTMDLKFSKATLQMWQRRAADALAQS
jgi:hypothetical protein